MHIEHCLYAGGDQNKWGSTHEDAMRRFLGCGTPAPSDDVDGAAAVNGVVVPVAFGSSRRSTTARCAGGRGDPRGERRTVSPDESATSASAAELAEHLARDPWPDVRVSAIESGVLSAETLTHLAMNDHSVQIRRSIARSPYAPAAVVPILVLDSDEQTRMFVAKYQARQHHVDLRVLAAFVDANASREVVQFWSLPARREWPEILEDLTADEHVQVLLALLVKPMPTVCALPQHPNPRVRAAVCYNRRLPDRLRVDLVGDLAPSVSEHAATTLRTLPKVQSGGS